MLCLKNDKSFYNLLQILIFMPKTILITGSNGLLGQKLVRRLLKKAQTQDINIVAVSRGASRLPFTEGYIYESIELTDFDKVEACLFKYLPDVVIHTAAITQVDICEENPDDCYLQNVKVLDRFLAYCATYRVHFCYISTDFVFDGTAGPYTEADTPNPISVYGYSKLAAENAVQNTLSNWSIVRTVLVYGINETNSRPNFPYWVKEKLENGETISVVNDQFRTPTCVEDLAWACIEIALNNKQGIYHISGEEMMSIEEFARKAADFWHLPQENIKSMDSSGIKNAFLRPPKTGFIIEKAKKELGYKPRKFGT